MRDLGYRLDETEIVDIDTHRLILKDVCVNSGFGFLVFVQILKSRYRTKILKFLHPSRIG